MRTSNKDSSDLEALSSVTKISNIAVHGTRRVQKSMSVFALPTVMTSNILTISPRISTVKFN